MKNLISQRAGKIYVRPYSKFCINTNEREKPCITWLNGWNSKLQKKKTHNTYQLTKSKRHAKWVKSCKQWRIEKEDLEAYRRIASHLLRWYYMKEPLVLLSPNNFPIL